jgi:TorA maturation chaperone TorD
VLEALGVTPDGVLARVPRDHLGFLLHLAAVALDDDDAAACSVARGLIDQALAPWVGRWTDAVLARAEQPVYRAHARLLAALLSPD